MLKNHRHNKYFIIITNTYNVLNQALIPSRIHNKLKTILSKYIHIYKIVLVYLQSYLYNH